MDEIATASAQANDGQETSRVPFGLFMLAQRVCWRSTRIVSGNLGNVQTQVVNSGEIYRDPNLETKSSAKEM